MQVVETVRRGYNSRRGTSFSRSDLLRPEVNVAIGADLLGRIAAAYDKHPDKNMRVDWTNPEFVKLVMAGWNSGYSEAGGVGRVARFLESQNVPVTHDNVFAAAAAAGATRHLQNDAKRRWQAQVAARYFNEPDRPSAAVRLLVPFGLAVALGWGIYRLAA